MPNYWKLILPTRFIYEWIRDSKSESQDKGKGFKLLWPSLLLVIEVLLVILLIFHTLNCALVAVGCFAASRVGEIVYAYYKDAMDSLEGRVQGPNDTNSNQARLTKADRIRLVIKSYGSLIIDWALIFFTLPVFVRSNSLFHIQAISGCASSCAFTSMIDALYFSGATITTTGFGDITPTHTISKILSVVEVLVGMVVLVLALGTYFGERTQESR